MLFKSEQLNDLKQLDLKVKGTIGDQSSGVAVTSSTSNSNIAMDAANAAATKASNENLYDEYRRRLELIKKVKPIK